MPSGKLPLEMNKEKKSEAKKRIFPVETNPEKLPDFSQCLCGGSGNRFFLPNGQGKRSICFSDFCVGCFADFPFYRRIYLWIDCICPWGDLCKFLFHLPLFGRQFFSCRVSTDLPDSPDRFSHYRYSDKQS